MQLIASQKAAKTLGRHSRLAVAFSWTVAGVAVDLAADGYTVRVWVTAPDGLTVTGPHPTTIAGTTATYLLTADDLTAASPAAGQNVKLVAVAESPTNTLVSDAREIVVGDWTGAETYTPAP